MKLTTASWYTMSMAVNRVSGQFMRVSTNHRPMVSMPATTIKAMMRLSFRLTLNESAAFSVSPLPRAKEINLCVEVASMDFRQVTISTTPVTAISMP